MQKNSGASGGAAGRDTRQAILDSARRLFNEHGVGSVSMRGIAADAGISVGNLTYYFPHKGDLVATLMAEDAEVTLAHEEGTGLARLDSIFSGMLHALQRNPFFFLDDQAQRMAGPEVIENTRQIHSQMDPVLDRLVESGLMQPTFRGRVRRQVMDVLMLSHITWLKLNTRSGKLLSMSLRELLDAHWTILGPWLTDAGRAELAEITAARDANPNENGTGEG